MKPLALIESRLERLFVPEPNSGCWLWVGFVDANGYGRFDSKYDSYAHRASYSVFRGGIPLGLDLDHLCRNKCCVNPDHLEPVTRKENLRRSPFIFKSCCAHGHPFTAENTWVDKLGYRHCRQCHKEAERRRKKRLKRAGELAENGVK